MANGDVGSDSSPDGRPESGEIEGNQAMANHVALKCTYNDGGAGPYVGFAGTCSLQTIQYNMKNRRVWCLQSECQHYYDHGFRGRAPNDPCYESALFRNWRFGAGLRSRDGAPMKVTGTAPGKLAILTTRFPYEPEKARRIVGLFQIGRVEDGENHETFLVADVERRIRLPLDVARTLYFWDFYSTKSGADWRTGLHRYLSDDQVHDILFALTHTLRDEHSKAIALHL
ncbi:MAG: hypothetical protein JRN15_10715, partial [Nitrososphaerota archaeon]|nr:hypothetical protein [Nitrososphaerota archaeon]